MKLESQIHGVLEKLSNNESDKLTVKDEWIEEAGEAFKDALRRQFTRQDEGFRLRMSNVGRPLCQLQQAKKKAKQERKSYNFIMRMLLGDAVESIMDVVLKIAGANITSSKDKVDLKIEKHSIKGETDLSIDGKVWDIKSSSSYAFDHKWKKGFPALQDDDAFGYVGQLIGYSEGLKKKPGGWIVVNKNNGEVLCMEAKVNKSQKQAVLDQMKMKADALDDGWKFRRCFRPEDDFFNRKYTNSKKLPMSCVFCDFRSSCWPNAKLLPQPKSKAKEPRKNWYVQYEGKVFK